MGGQLGLGAVCLAQRLLPVGLQRARHQPVLRLAGVELPPRALGVVARALEGEFERSEAGGLGGLLVGQRLGGRGDRRGLEDAEDLLQHRLVELASAESLALFPVGRVVCDLPLARVAVVAPRVALAAAGARVGRAHPPRAAPAAQEPLQQRLSLARCGALARGGGVAGDLVKDLLVLLEGDVRLVVVEDQRVPALARHRHHRHSRTAVLADAPLRLAAAERVRARVGRVGEHLVHGAVGRLDPLDLPLPAAARHKQPVLAQRQHHLANRAQLREPPEHVRDRLPHGLISADHDLAVGRVVIAGRQLDVQLALGRLVASPATSRLLIR